jgi:hypothetical protein
MKYNAKQLSNGQWAVFAGKQYWEHTVSDTKEEAHIWAIKESAIWHQQQLDKLEDEFGIVEGSTLKEWIC